MVADYCGSNIAANTTCSIIVSYTANSSFVSSNSINNQPAVQVTKAEASAGLYALAASNQGASQLVISPSILNIYSESSENEFNLTLSNSGNIPITSLKTSSITSDGATIDLSQCISHLPLSPFNHQTCQASVKKARHMSQAATLNINYADAESSNKLTPITINPYALQPTSSSYNFITFESNPVTTNITLTNVGSQAITLGSLEGNIGYGDIDLAGCPSTINPGSNITCQLIFSPKSTGTGTVTANLNWNANGNSDKKTLTLTFHIEVNSSPILISSTSSLTFNQNIFGQPESKTFTLTNSGKVDISNLTLSPTSSSALTSQGFNTPNLCNGNISAESSCEVTLTYNPSSQESTTASIPLSFSYNYTTKKGNTYTTTSVNLLQVNYSTGWAPDVVCATSSASIALGTIYYGDPSSTAESSITCTNIGSEPALVNWESGTSFNGFTVSPTLPQQVTGNGGSITFAFTANPFTSNAGATIINPTITYTGVTSGITGKEVLASSISYAVIPWFSASLSNCTNIGCSINIVNNSPADSLTLTSSGNTNGLNPISSCGSINGGESCTISFTFESNSLTALSSGINNSITITAGSLSYNFNYLANKILYMGGNFLQQVHQNYLVYYQPYLESAMNAYCYTGYADLESGVIGCKESSGNNKISSLLFNPNTGGVYIGTKYLPSGGGAVYSTYLVKGLTGNSVTTYLGPVNSNCNNGSSCNVNSLAMSNGTLAAATPTGFYYYNNNQWQPFSGSSESGGSNALAGIAIESQYCTACFLAIAGNGVSIVSPTSVNSLLTLPSNGTPLAQATGQMNESGITQQLMFEATDNGISMYFMDESYYITSKFISWISSPTAVTSMNFISSNDQNSGELVVTTPTNVYYANFQTGQAVPQQLSNISVNFLQPDEQITSSALDVNGDIYVGTHKGRVYYLPASGSIGSYSYSSAVELSSTRFTNRESINAMAFGYNVQWALTENSN